MACATLKRPLEWSDPSMSPPRNDAAIQNEHHHHHHQPSPISGGHWPRPAKKRCLSHASIMVPPVSHKETSPFGEVQPKLTSENIAASIREEMLRLYHRKKLQTNAQLSPNCGSESGHGSGIMTNSGSTCSQDGSSSINQDMSNVSSTSVGLLSPTRRDTPLFTFRQVGLICERLLKERELQIRQEYDYVLTTKLAEQYDTFVKFTYDQIQKRFENGSIPSYLS